MKKSRFTLEHTRQLTADTYEVVLSGDTSAITAPGQFVNLELPGKFLRRPISICNWTEEGALMLLVKVVGEGTRGFVTDCIRALPECDYVYTCGPLPMLKAVHQLPQLTGGQFSFEARMGCGFGACMGCTVPTVDGYKRVCKDGPILYKEEVVW